MSRLAPQPAAFHAAVFFLVNASYIALIWELIEREAAEDLSPAARKFMRLRSLVTLGIFAAAAVVALKLPLLGLGMCCCCLIVYLKPEAAAAGKQHATPTK